MAFPDESRISGPTTIWYVPELVWAVKPTSNCVLLEPATAVMVYAGLIAPFGPVKLAMSAGVNEAGSTVRSKVRRTVVRFTFGDPENSALRTTGPGATGGGDLGGRWTDQSYFPFA